MMPGERPDMAADQRGRLYLALGFGFVVLRYDPAKRTWDSLLPAPDVLSYPVMAPVTLGDSDYMYATPGSGPSFLRLNCSRGRWEFLPRIPGEWALTGIWIVYDQSRWVYCLKGKLNEMYRFDVFAGAWDTVRRAPMPRPKTRGGGFKRPGRGGGAVWYQGRIYALKGRCSQSFYSYDPEADSWSTLEPIPKRGSSGRLKTIKKGADMAVAPDGILVIKGGQESGLWHYSPLGSGGVQADAQARAGWGLAVVPSPAKRRARVEFELPIAACVDVVVVDAGGRVVRRLARGTRPAGRHQVELAVGPVLGSGVYVVTMETKHVSLSRRFVLQE
jgi:hypothetical protein